MLSDKEKDWLVLVIAGLIFTPIVRALIKLSTFGALAATSIGLAFVYGIYRIHNRLPKPKKRILNEKNQKNYVEQRSWELTGKKR